MMKLITLPRQGDSLIRYILFYLIGCSVSFPTTYYLLSGDLSANFSFTFFVKHGIQGIVVGAIGGIFVYWFERSRKAS
jgi:hypothetical protein